MSCILKTKFTKLLLAILFVFYGRAVEACSCTGPDVFEQSIQEYTAWIEVIGRKEIYYKEGQERPNYVTVLRVIERFSLNGPTDTIELLEDTGFECYTSLSSSNEGGQFIITGNFAPKTYLDDGGSLKVDVFILDLCAEGELKVRNDKVYGFIDKNAFTKAVRRLNQKSKKVSDLWEEYDQKGYLAGDQREKYVNKYQAKMDRVERGRSKMNRKLKEGDYFQSMSLERFRKWIIERV
jgi:hypothetical protein